MMNQLKFQKFAALSFMSLICLLLNSTVMAQNPWKPTQGPYGGTVQTIVSNAKGQLFAGTQGAGIFRSEDAGTNWQAAASGLASLDIRALAVNIEDQIFAGTNGGGVFRSSDAGQSWQPVNTGLIGAQFSVLAIAIEPESQNIYLGTGNGVLRSTDNGDSWGPATAGLPNDIAVEALAVNPFTLELLAGIPQAGLFRSADQGGKWEQIDSGFGATSITFAGDNFIFVGTAEGIYLSRDNGLNWVPANTGLAVPVVQALAVGVQGEIYAGTDGGGLYQSTDFGTNWVLTDKGLTSNSILAIAKGINGELFVGTGGASAAATASLGVYRSTDGGKSWEVANNGLTNTRVSALLTTDRGSILAGTRGNGIFRSRDSGGTWTWLTRGLDIGPVNDMLFDPQSQGAVLVAVDAFGAGIFRSSNDGDTWVQFTKGLENAPAIQKLAQNTKGELWAAGDNLYLSQDNGSSWSLVNIGLADELIVELFVSAKDILFVTTSAARMLRSSDSGQSWLPVTNGVEGTRITAMAQRLGGELLAVSASGALFSSLDDGQSWSGIGAIAQRTTINKMVTAKNGVLLALAENQGVFVSADNGRSWQLFSDGLPAAAVLSLTIDSQNQIFAGIDGQGVFVNALPLGAQDVFWNAALSGNWSEPGNWSTNTVPTALDRVFITQAGDYTVTLDIPATVQHLELGALDAPATGRQILSTNNQTLAIGGAAKIQPQAELLVTVQSVLSFAGRLENLGTITWQGGAISAQDTLENSGAVDLETTADKFWQNGFALKNSGIVRVADTFSLQSGSGASLLNAANGVFQIEGTLQWNGNPDPGSTTSLVNRGKITFSANGAQAALDLDLQNSGQIDVQNGILRIPSGMKQNSGATILAGGSIESAGSIEISGGALRGAGLIAANLVMGGQFQPGADIGLLEVRGDYTQSESGLLEMEIGSESSFDRVSISGVTNLAGRLDILLLNGFVPAPDNRFALIGFGSLNGDFTTVNGLQINDALRFQTEIGANDYSFVTVAPNLTLTPQTVDFGATQLGERVLRTIALANTGSIPVSVTTVAVTGAHNTDFVLQDTSSPITLQPGESSNLQVAFQPSAAGERVSELTVTSNAPTSPDLVQLRGTGVVVEPALMLTPQTVDFGATQLGDSVLRTIKLANVGEAAAVVSSIAIAGTHSTDFVLQDTSSPITLQAGESANLQVAFQPLVAGERIAGLVIVSNAPSSPDTVQLQGRGMMVEPALMLTPQAIDFGATQLGDSVLRTINLANVGEAAAVVSSIVIAGTHSTDFVLQDTSSPTTLQPGESANLQVAFQPLAAGERVAELVIVSNAPSSPDTVQLQGRGMTVEPALTLTPQTVEFGEMGLGKESLRTVTLTNDGGTTLSVAAIAIAGANSTDFILQDTGSTISLQPGESANLTIAFQPSASGQRIADLTVTSNAPSSPDRVQLHGTGVQPFDMFTQIVEGPVVAESYNSTSSSWVDFDLDGDFDLFFTTGDADVPNQLFENDGAGNFSLADAGALTSDVMQSFAASWGDIDNDGDADVFIANADVSNSDFLIASFSAADNALYINNGDGSFTRVLYGAIVTDGGFSVAASWADFDHDGMLDLFVANQQGGNFLYRNTSSADSIRFAKITTGEVVTDGADSFGCTWADYDRDGDVDLFVLNGAGANNTLYRNNGDGGFTKLADVMISTEGGSSRGASWGDFDNDGDLDLIVTNHDAASNFFYQNNGDGSFSKMNDSGFTGTFAFNTGSAWGDFDGDGDLDLVVAGNDSEVGNNVLFLNLGNGAFEPQILPNNLAASVLANGVSTADFDNDGDLDFAIANNGRNFLYRNNGHNNNWISIQLIGSKSNRSAIGAKITLQTSIDGQPVSQFREIAAQTGGGFGGQNSAQAFFGLGTAQTASALIIEWPSGGKETLGAFVAKQFLAITEKITEYGEIAVVEPEQTRVGESLVIDVMPPQAFTAVSGQLFYRSAGRSTYESEPINVSGSSLNVTIPPSAVTERGVQYYIEITDGETTITLPPIDPQNNPRFIPARISRLAAASTPTAEKFRMISVPMTLAQSAIDSVLFDDLGRYETFPRAWRLFRWERLGYREYSEIEAEFTPGTAFWLITREAVNFDVDNATSVSAAAPYQITLRPGWNQIACPFAFPVSWDAVSADGAVQNPVFFDGDEYQFDVPVLEPWQGYFVFNLSLTPTILTIPPVEAEIATTRQGKMASRALTDISSREFVLQISAQAAGESFRDTQNFIGFRDGAKAGLDDFDFFDAPAISDELSISIIENGDQFAGNFRDNNTEGSSWDVRIDANSLKSDILVSLRKIGALPDEFGIFVFDMQKEAIVPLQNGMFRVASDAAKDGRLYKIVIGTEKAAGDAVGDIPLVPTAFELQQNYPNPFNPETVIRYQLSEAGEVELTVFDRMGREVAVLVQTRQSAGEHLVKWDGRSADGQAVPSGIYLYRLRAGNLVSSRKMLLVR